MQMRSAAEIRAYFYHLLNESLSRLSMFGGEIVLHNFLGHLAHIDKREEELHEHMLLLKSRGAFSSTGIGDAIKSCTSLKAPDGEIASVYAAIAFRMGYLNTRRVLSKEEFKKLRRGLRATCIKSNFDTEGVVNKYGEPSWRTGGINPLFPRTFLYLCNDLANGVIAFDFWNKPCYDDQDERTYGKYGELPILRNVRIQENRFAKEYTFTPIGREIIDKT